MLFPKETFLRSVLAASLRNRRRNMDLMNVLAIHRKTMVLLRSIKGKGNKLTPKRFSHLIEPRCRLQDENASN